MSDWRDAAKAKAASTIKKIPRAWALPVAEIERASRRKEIAGDFILGFLTTTDRQIVTTPALELVQKLSRGDLRAEAVTLAFCKAAAIAHQLNNCLHEIFFEQALERARYLDEYFHEHGRTVGPLHGLPISLKDQFHVKGVDTTMGYVGWIDTFEGGKDPNLVRQVNSQVVDELQSLGAVLFCKTSVPQTLMYGETKNNIIGQTLNPWNKYLSCGGSSGGEAALQALCASPVGLGTDLGGSVRVPAAFCGLFALKPTHDRLSYRKVANTNPGQETYPSSVGIIGSSIEALELVLRSMLLTQPWLRDPNVIPLPWRQDLAEDVLAHGLKYSASTVPLRFAVFNTDNVVTPHPPIQRALRNVEDTLKAAGYDTVDWNPPSHDVAVKIHLSFLNADGGYDIDQQLRLSGEPLLPDLADIIRRQEPMTAIQHQLLTLDGKRYCEAYSDYWNSTGKNGHLVDAVIMPVAPYAAVLPGKLYHAAYTEAINVMDYSVVVIPVTRADKQLDRADALYQPLNKVDELNWNAYDPEIYDGAPVGLQIVARKYEEEKVCAIGKIVHELLASKI